ncbi:hypothetical protein QTP86_016421 [Hemibagrus guttatus]|nr:hypothetical protein QTP86_016421 [Hemibagrus guttatus]
MRVKTLREKFQNNESSKMRIKPAIPEKPKTIPPISPTAKISNPLIASINSAVENRMVPRVVFKDDKKTRPLSQPEPSMVKAKPILLDKNQKKEADLIKQALKDKKILPMSPVSPVFEQKPKSESIQKSPGFETPVKVPTPFKKAILNKPDKDELERTDLSEWDIPVSPVRNHSDSSNSTHAKTEATVKKPLAPPVRANPTISPPVISHPAFSPSKPPALTVPQPVYQNGPQMENPRSEIPIRHNSNVISPTADIFEYGLPEDAVSIPESPDIIDMDIPPPIIPKDFSDGPSDLDILPSEPLFPRATFAVTPVFQSPALHCTDSPHPYSDSVFTFSPLPERSSPSMNFESIGENRLTESPKITDHTEKPLEVPFSSSPMAASVVSALARAEEMAPAKHSSCDQRLLNLLEKANRKSTVGTKLSTPEILPVHERDLPSNSPLESSPTETAHAEAVSHVEPPNVPEPLNHLDIPPVDYEGKTEKAATEYNTQPHETSFNNQDHNPYAETPTIEELPKKVLFSKKNSLSDEKELTLKEKKSQKEKEKEKEKEQKEKEKEKKEQKDKKKEQKDKEKDKKELKDKEKEKKEQKEREKKENEIKKKFKITGNEEALYQAKVTETIKGRKDDLAIKAGDIVSIIRTTDCPKGKWLARDSTNKYGYIPLESVELNIQEMMALGNKAKANNRPSINGIIDSNTPSTDIIPSRHYSMSQESFEDDSEEWGDDDDTVFQPDHTTDIVLNDWVSSPDGGPKTGPGLPAHTDRSDNAHGGREALHKLSTFFAQPTVPILQSSTPPHNKAR